VVPCAKPNTAKTKPTPEAAPAAALYIYSCIDKNVSSCCMRGKAVPREPNLAANVGSGVVVQLHLERLPFGNPDALPALCRQGKLGECTQCLRAFARQTKVSPPSPQRGTQFVHACVCAVYTASAQSLAHSLTSLSLPTCLSRNAKLPFLFSRSHSRLVEPDHDTLRNFPCAML